jgi:hypothetical protein
MEKIDDRIYKLNDVAHITGEYLDANPIDRKTISTVNKQEAIPICIYILYLFCLDEDGFHRVGNKSHVDGAVTLHLYSPPFSKCRKFDDDTSNATEVPMGFDQDFSEECCARSYR